jgi:hypothetical protein
MTLKNRKSGLRLLKSRKRKHGTKPSSNGHGLRLKLTRWAKELGFDPKTVGQRLRVAGHVVAKDKLYHLREVVAAVYGDEQAERNRNLKLDADRKEREEREAKGQLIDRALAEKQIAELYTLPLGQALAGLPSKAAAQCNPGNAELAHEALQRAVEEIKKQIRDGLPTKVKS